jgi:hypothetical protein
MHTSQQKKGELHRGVLQAVPASTLLLTPDPRHAGGGTAACRLRNAIGRRSSITIRNEHMSRRIKNGVDGVLGAAVYLCFL